jgi:hypothetical protein
MDKGSKVLTDVEPQSPVLDNKPWSGGVVALCVQGYLRGKDSLNERKVDGRLCKSLTEYWSCWDS